MCLFERKKIKKEVDQNVSPTSSWDKVYTPDVQTSNSKDSDVNFENLKTLPARLNKLRENRPVLGSRLAKILGGREKSF